jgi:FkbM family methyltransferase
MKKIFIDCGFHYGEALKQFVLGLGIDHDWYVFAFEPNPVTFERATLLGILPKETGGYLAQSAVWTEAGEIDFCQEDHTVSKSKSINPVHPLDGWASAVATLQSNASGLQKPIRVPALDFSNWLKNYSEYEVYCKMDIEGSEFPVLRKLLADGTIGIIKKLWVEWHDRFLPDETEETRLQLIDELSKHTEVLKWD